MSGGGLLWRRANEATLKTLKGEYKGQYHLILGKTDQVTAFFEGLPRAVDGKGSNIDLWTEPLPRGSGESPPWRLTVRRNSSTMARPDEWYVSSQQPGSAHPLWRPGAGPLPDTKPEADYAILLRTENDRFYAGWLRNEQVEALPEALRKQLESAKVSARTIETSEVAAVLGILGQPQKAVDGETDPGTTPPLADLSDDEVEPMAQEGQLKLVQHGRRERSPSLRRKRIELVGGQPRCEACAFDFTETYGKRGKGFIECHHVIPLSAVDPATPTKLEDLALLCANCHRMVHAKRPWLSIEELKQLLDTPIQT